MTTKHHDPATIAANLALYELATDAVKDVTYYQGQPGKALAAIRKAGCEPETITVAVGGYRLNITHTNGLLLSITPRATSAGRGDLYLNPKASGYFMLELGSGPYAGVKYDYDKFGSQRLQSALLLAITAALDTLCETESLYAALGKSGFCAICGATLTDELSMSRGIGPECYKKVYKVQAIRAVQTRRIEKAQPKPTPPVPALAKTAPVPAAAAMPGNALRGQHHIGTDDDKRRHATGATLTLF